MHLIFSEMFDIFRSLRVFFGLDASAYSFCSKIFSTDFVLHVVKPYVSSNSFRLPIRRRIVAGVVWQILSLLFTPPLPSSSSWSVPLNRSHADLFFLSLVSGRCSLLSAALWQLSLDEHSLFDDELDAISSNALPSRNRKSSTDL